MPVPRWLSVGRITSPFGVRGEMHLFLHTEFPERLTKRTVYMGDDRVELRIAALRMQKQQAIIRVKGVDTVEGAEGLRGKELFIAAQDATPLPDGRFYTYQIVGLQVYTTTGEHYGVVRDVLDRPANDIYVVEHQQRELLIPAIKDVVKDINIETGTMIIDVIPGLED